MEDSQPTSRCRVIPLSPFTIQVLLLSNVRLRYQRNICVALSHSILVQLLGLGLHTYVLIRRTDVRSLPTARDQHHPTVRLVDFLPDLFVQDTVLCPRE